MREEASFHMFLEKDDPKRPGKEKFLVIMRKEKLLLNLHLRLRNTATNIFIKQLI